MDSYATGQDEAKVPCSDLLPKHTKWAHLAPGVSALVPQEKGLLFIGCIINTILIGEMEW